MKVFPLIILVVGMTNAGIRILIGLLRLHRLDLLTQYFWNFQLSISFESWSMMQILMETKMEAMMETIMEFIPFLLTNALQKN